MNKYKKLWQDYYDQVVSLDGLEQQVEQAEHVSQLQRYINYKMKPIYQSDKASQLWFVTPEQKYQYQKIIDTLILQRKSKGYTIESLAMTIGTDTKTLGDWERKVKEPRLFNLLCWCEALQVYLNVQLNDGEF